MKLLPREVAYRKMENMVQAAREVERELDAGGVDVEAPASADD
ncbi:MAG: 5-methyltetrahydropteroyltriglutamate--homocysteine methyltransferase [Salinirussus sp.]